MFQTSVYNHTKCTQTRDADLQTRIVLQSTLLPNTVHTYNET